LRAKTNQRRVEVQTSYSNHVRIAVSKTADTVTELVVDTSLLTEILVFVVTYDMRTACTY